jgi:hypothetical protein
MTNSYQYSLTNMQEARRLDNYKIIKGNLKNGKCIVFFSGNGLYFPNIEKELNKIITDDKYEWEKLYPHNYEKIIFIRDVYKQWYIEGINTELDNIDKLKVFLDKEIKGYTTTFVGSSAGGYASVLFGNLCGADLSISLSGQFDLSEEKQRDGANEILNKSIDERYIDVSGLVNNNVVYFYPCYSKEDKHHKQLAQNNKNITIIEIKSSFHGVPFYPFALKKLLYLNIEQYKELSIKKHNMLIFSFKYCNWIDFYYWSSIQLKKLIMRIRTRFKLVK